ncbi:hypothetical protein L916_11825 [Phytophthora nicotianae]|uniref:Uncharacterized protein n=1 Tax=Phytophthora nicotianae TaxID=4792 RepID=W2IS15_PHYNI|nr:hypothetical protein L916_11825 [Phytophthora nicotianae]
MPSKGRGSLFIGKEPMDAIEHPLRALFNIDQLVDNYPEDGGGQANQGRRQRLGSNPTEYSTHSLRIAGACALRAAEKSEPVIKLMGEMVKLVFFGLHANPSWHATRRGRAHDQRINLGVPKLQRQASEGAGNQDSLTNQMTATNKPV